MNGIYNDIVITGLAAISAGGVGIGPLRETLLHGKSMLTPVPTDILPEPGHLWGRATGFRVADFMPPLKARKFDRCSLFATIAAGMALQDAALDVSSHNPERIGIALGCGFGGIANSEEFLRAYFQKGVEGLIPMLFPNSVPNAPASNASIEHGFKGPNVTQVQRFCSAESAFLMACRFIEEGRADVMLTGGADDLAPVMLKGFHALGQLRGYAAGFGEGSGILVLERREHALRRGAAIRGSLGGIRTVGHLLAGREAEGIARLKGRARPDIVSLSGTAADHHLLLEGMEDIPPLEVGKLVGRSLAMGGIAMVALFLTLGEGKRALHLAASPEGPYYGIEFLGGSSVQP
ncbi:MAG TPA: beta-ketoacyl synthase N-terminal-like domain-containing protein [Geobacteraceae bacterium]|nr:beta-ketoacyl synthase N-terminal-like domain-containing protein [Geobacteraceae bacterium]